ncbi:hypothetical protein ACRALDRAFT_2034225, partial [Sodiomyces alcalophilus JCM 7366]|uniref:uncharacterized protein n=1 Tax=Sodiomyces alcalophilus JCM 7366 TaxID=591952 RepID=UPI0039B45B4C
IYKVRGGGGLGSGKWTLEQKEVKILHTRLGITHTIVGKGYNYQGVPLLINNRQGGCYSESFSARAVRCSKPARGYGSKSRQKAKQGCILLATLDVSEKCQQGWALWDSTVHPGITLRKNWGLPSRRVRLLSCRNSRAPFLSSSSSRR